MRTKRAAIIYNPVARGLSHRQHLLQRIIPILAKQGIEATPISTTGPGSAEAQTREQIAAGCDLIIAAGGDGTINEVANGMLHSGIPLAILPGGTANVLAREMRMPIHIERVAGQIANMRASRVAAGRLRYANGETRCFLCMAGAGLDAQIIYHLDLRLKTLLGKLAYYLGGFSQILKPLHEFEVTVDGHKYEASFALISRVRNYGGDLEIARGASLLRSDFEVVLFRGNKSVQYLPYLAGVALGFAARMKGCTVLRGRSVSCHRRPGQDIYVQVDGELAGELPVTAEIMPDALTLLVPPEYLAREQSYLAVPVCA